MIPDWTKWAIATAVMLAAGAPLAGFGGGQAKNWNAVNRLRVEYDDNVNESETNEQDSFKILEQVDLSYNFNLDQTFLSLRYQPTFIWWSDRPGDDADLNHAFDGVFNHSFSRRVSLSLKDTFRYAENPDVIDRGSVIRESNNFIYNSALGALSYLINQTTRLEGAGRIVVLRYDEDEVARRNDYDLYVGGLTVYRALNPSTAALGEFRYESLGYDEDGRDSDTLYLGAGIERTFSPTFLGSLRAGYQGRDFDQAASGSQDTPYVDGSATFIPSASSRLTLGASFSQYEASISPYASTERTRVFASLAHDFTAKISGYLTGAYSQFSYDGQDTPSGDLPGGDEDFVQVGARASYKIDRRNFVEAGWQLTDSTSDLRNDFTRNRVSLGWVLKL
jgi:hypothetical protein